MANGGKRIRKAGALEGLKKKIWQAITTAEEILLSEEADFATKIRAIHALTQAASTYSRLILQADVKSRIEEMEGEEEEE